jgi:hypothetical protein
MTEHTFPEPQPINWDALEEGDTVWIKAIVTRTLTDHPRKFVSQAYVYLDFHDPSEEVQAVRATTIRLGHVIKAPPPIAVGDIAVGDMVSIPLTKSTYEVLAISDEMAWVTDNLAYLGSTPCYYTFKLTSLVRVEP